MDGLRLPRLFSGTGSRILNSALVGLIASLFVSALLLTTSVFAATASWNGEVLTVDDQAFVELDNTTKQKLGIDTKNTAYGFVPNSTSQSGEAKAVVFPGAADLSKATNGTLTNYTFTPPDTYTKGKSETVNVPARPEDSNASGQCKVDGVGWMACPVSRWLATGMDWMYSVLDGFLEAKPPQTDTQNNPLYEAWLVMRNIANAVFVIGFIILIYSHLTSLGISNYGVKKLLPRIVIAAVAVNLSYWICAIAIDLSNLTGYGVQSLFQEIRLATQSSASPTEDLLSWESVIEIILSGGAGLAVLGVGSIGLFAASSGSIASMLYLALPLLVGAILTLLVVLLILAARQALIVILTVISPLAIVCYLLPGTETYFSKWRSLFFTMLIFFPAFSAVFGGSQLAGSIIISNAQTFTTLILGLAVQVAPLVLAPLILKLSGGLLNRIAGIVNNPNRGILDQTKSWARERAEDSANRQMGKDPSSFKRRQLLARTGRWAGERRRSIKEKSAIHAAQAENSWRGSSAYSALDPRRRMTEQDKSLVDSKLEKSWNNQLLQSPSMAARDMRVRTGEQEVELAKGRLTTRFSEFESVAKDADGNLVAPLSRLNGFSSLTSGQETELNQIRSAAHATHEQIAINALRGEHAKRALNQQFSKELSGNDAKLQEAGGILGHGSDAALANAVATMRTEYGKSVGEAAQVIKHFGIDANQRQELAVQIDKDGKSTSGVIKVTKDGVTRTFSPQDAYIRDAAIEENVTVGTVKQVKQILERVADDSSFAEEYGTTVAQALPKSSAAGKAGFLGGRMINEVTQAISGEGDLVKKGLNGYVAEWLQQQKFTNAGLSKMDKDSFNIIREVVSNPKYNGIIGPASLSKLKAGLEYIRDPSNEVSSNLASNAAEVALDIEELIKPKST